MIGPLGDARQIYSAACGRQFSTCAQGVDHERECLECQREIRREMSAEKDAPDGHADLIEAALCVVCTAFGNTHGLTDREQLEALRMACRSLRCELKALGY